MLYEDLSARVPQILIIAFGKHTLIILKSVANSTELKIVSFWIFLLYFKS